MLYSYNKNLFKNVGTAGYQKRIQKPIKHLKWFFLRKKLTVESSFQHVWLGSEYIFEFCI